MIWPRWRQRTADGSLVTGATDPPSGGPDMRRSRFVAGALMLIALASTATSLSSPARDGGDVVLRAGPVSGRGAAAGRPGPPPAPRPPRAPLHWPRARRR